MAKKIANNANNANNGAGGDQFLDYTGFGNSNDVLIGGGGNDTLVGGDGDDFLNGGGGSDTYRFYFTVEGGQQTLTFPGFDPGSDGKLQENEFQNQYKAWLNEVGTDLNDDGEIERVWHQNDDEDSLVSLEGATTDGEVLPVNIYPNNQNNQSVQTRYYESSVTVGSPEQITAADGNDTIAQFQNAGPNVDKIELYGITKEQAAALFTYESGDFDADSSADDARISWQGATDDADGSITILGSTWADLDAFLNDPNVLFLTS